MKKLNLIKWFCLVLLTTLYLTVQAAPPAQIANQMYQNGKTSSYILNTLVFKHGADPLVATEITTKVAHKNASGMELRMQLFNLIVAATFIAPDIAPEIVASVLQNVSTNKLPYALIALVAMIVVPESYQEILAVVTVVIDTNASPLTSVGDFNMNFLITTTFQNGFYGSERFSRNWSTGGRFIDEEDDKILTPQIGGQFKKVSPD